jgi:hypothetical protein
VPISANGSPGFAFDKPAGPGGPYGHTATREVEPSEGKIIGTHAFLDRGLFALCGVPRILTE